jgi:hypothetical protein
MPTFDYRVFPVDDSAVKTGTIEWPGEPGFDAINKLVQPLIGGGHIEHVSVLHEGKPRDMFVDEEGLIKGFERNERATRIYRTNWLTRHPDCDPETLNFIAGPAVLFTKRVWY